MNLIHTLGQVCCCVCMCTVVGNSEASLVIKGPLQVGRWGCVLRVGPGMYACVRAGGTQRGQPGGQGAGVSEHSSEAVACGDVRQGKHCVAAGALENLTVPWCAESQWEVTWACTNRKGPNFLNAHRETSVLLPTQGGPGKLIRRKGALNNYTTPWEHER